MRAAKAAPGTSGSDRFYQCPDCGFKQKSDAAKRIRCHRCGHSYRPGKAKTVAKTPDEEKGLGFFRYTGKEG